MASIPSSVELDQYRQSLAEDQNALSAIDALEQTQDFATAFSQLYEAQYGPVQVFGVDKPSLWQVLLKRVRQEICGSDDSLRSLIQQYKKNPGNATLITGFITALVSHSNLQLPIDSAIATAIALYIMHIGIDVFCDWSIPPTPPNA
jgi:hypothetical protein